MKKKQLYNALLPITLISLFNTQIFALERPSDVWNLFSAAPFHIAKLDTISPCSVSVSLSSHSNNAPDAVLTASPTGTAPFIYKWTSFGNAETGPDKQKTLNVWKTDEYCAIVKDATGCISADCHAYNPDSFYCTTRIFMEPFPDHALLTLWGYTNASIPTIQWSTGDNTPSLTIYQSGTYAVTTTNYLGCISTDDIDVPACNKLTVNVEMVDSLDGVAAKVYLYQMGTVPPVLIDSAFTDEIYGMATFEHIPMGDYTVSATLLPTSPWYQQYDPVNYAENASDWQQAQTVPVELFCAYGDGEYLIVWLHKIPAFLDNALVSPNPVSNNLFINLQNQAFFFRLLDMNGQVLKTEDVPAQPGSYQLSMQQYGGNSIYFLQIRIGNQWQVFRIVKI